MSTNMLTFGLHRIEFLSWNLSLSVYFHVLDTLDNQGEEKYLYRPGLLDIVVVNDLNSLTKLLIINL